MDRHWAYCSACDRQVEVVVRPDEQVVCLEVGHTCTGALCPITDVPPDEMREALDEMRRAESTDGGKD